MMAISRGEQRLLDHLTAVLALNGAEHARTGAVVSAVRGQQRLSRQQFGARFGLTPRELERAERGDIDLVELPVALQARCLALDCWR